MRGPATCKCKNKQTYGTRQHCEPSQERKVEKVMVQEEEVRIRMMRGKWRRMMKDDEEHMRKIRRRSCSTAVVVQAGA